MTKETLSEKLFVQRDGKKFAYAEDIKEKIKELKEELNEWVANPHDEIKPEHVEWKDIIKVIDKIFGDELTK